MDRDSNWIALCNGDDVFLWSSEYLKNEKDISSKELEMLELFMNRKDELGLLEIIMDKGWSLVWRKPLGDYIYERMNSLLRVVDDELSHNVYFKFMLV